MPSPLTSPAGATCQPKSSSAALAGDRALAGGLVCACASEPPSSDERTISGTSREGTFEPMASRWGAKRVPADRHQMTPFLRRADFRIAKGATRRVTGPETCQALAHRTPGRTPIGHRGTRLAGSATDDASAFDLEPGTHRKLRAPAAVPARVRGTHGSWCAGAGHAGSGARTCHHPPPGARSSTAAGLLLACQAQPRGGPVPLTVSFRAFPSGGTGSYAFDWRFGDGGRPRSPTRATPICPADSSSRRCWSPAGIRSPRCERSIAAVGCPGPAPAPGPGPGPVRRDRSRTS